MQGLVAIGTWVVPANGGFKPVPGQTVSNVRYGAWPTFHLAGGRILVGSHGVAQAMGGASTGGCVGGHHGHGLGFHTRLGREVQARRVTIDLSQAHFGDITSVTALDKICQKLRKHGSAVEVLGMNEQSRALVSKLDLGIE